MERNRNIERKKETRSHLATLQNVPDSQELRLLSRGRALGLPRQGLDVVDGQDGRGDEPGQAEDGANDNHDENDEQVQMVSASFL